ncbi:MAG: alpha/beta fold hydrolase [Phenylobacterium sp.]|uniref:alpha/beta hydrolase n=1 Tax=Phenylobacterium sp. TaxID=1871053 RepID=UPI00120A1180|nr:alpha/beta fold hydrolase [Phenylobacterium sp.]TAJ73890.1 MAG: alpha/beta fold hydrolase [Phenylobacterium sp.]
MRRLWGLALVALALVAGPVQASDHRPGDLVLEPGSVTAPDGRLIRFELGTLYVPENRASPGSRIIGVGFARIRATTPGDAPPVFLLPGGPGNSYLNAFTDRDAAAAAQLTGILPYTAAADVVIVDQRGFSRRGEVLELTPAPMALDRAGAPATEAEAAIAFARGAVAANPGRDLAGYTVTQCAEDVNDLRRALGYARLTLSGQSFGSQWSFAVMRLHPEIVARALISGAEPLAKNYDMPSQVFAAFQRIAWEADHDQGLAPHLPSGGVMAALTAVRDRFAAGPITAQVPGEAASVVLGLTDLQAALIRPAADWPAFVLEVYRGRYETLARETLARRRGSPVRLIQPLIDSSVGVSPGREHLLRTDPAVSYLGVGDFDPLIAAASAWPTPDAGDDFRNPFQSPIPMLFIHGDWDTSTPLENMLGALPYFPKARAVVAHRAGHQSRAAVFARAPEVLAAVIGFLRTGEVRDLPSEVWLPAPTFRVPAP